jgi:hypothetical protein
VKDEPVFAPMGIMTILTFHAIQVLMHLIFEYICPVVTMETQLLTGEPEQFPIHGLVWIMTGRAVSSSYRTMQVSIYICHVFVAGIAESGFRFNHLP